MSSSSNAKPFAKPLAKSPQWFDQFSDQDLKRLLMIHASDFQTSRNYRKELYRRDSTGTNQADNNNELRVALKLRSEQPPPSYEASALSSSALSSSSLSSSSSSSSPAVNNTHDAMKYLKEIDEIRAVFEFIELEPHRLMKYQHRIVALVHRAARLVSPKTRTPYAEVIFALGEVRPIDFKFVNEMKRGRFAIAFDDQENRRWSDALPRVWAKITSSRSIAVNFDTMDKQQLDVEYERVQELP